MKFLLMKILVGEEFQWNHGFPYASFKFKDDFVEQQLEGIGRDDRDEDDEYGFFISVLFLFLLLLPSSLQIKGIVFMRD